MDERVTLLLPKKVIINDFGTQLSYTWKVGTEELGNVYENLCLIQDQSINKLGLKFLNHKLILIKSTQNAFDLDTALDVSVFNIDNHSLDYILKFLSNHLDSRNEVNHVDIDFAYKIGKHATLTIEFDK
jgi:hypothetical protein